MLFLAKNNVSYFSNITLGEKSLAHKHAFSNPPGEGGGSRENRLQFIYFGHDILGMSSHP